MKNEIEKYCPLCKETKLRKFFGISNTKYDGLCSYCLECMKIKRKEHYNRNKPAQIERNKKASGELREIVLEIKKQNCVDCGISYPNEPWLMEFDHRDPSIKEDCISRFVNGGYKTKLMAELKKCDLLCVVCHRRRTAKMFNWVDNRFLD